MGMKTFVVTLFIGGFWLASIPLGAIAAIWGLKIPMVAIQIWATIGLSAFVMFLLFGAIMNLMEGEA